MRDILIFNKITDLKMAPLIQISTKNDCCYDKNVIVSIADFLVEYFNLNGNHWFSVKINIRDQHEDEDFIDLMGMQIHFLKGSVV